MSQPDLPATRPSLGPPALGLRHRLMVWAGNTVEPRILPRTGVVSIGRAADANVRIDAPSISRRHAELLLSAHEVHIRDLGSQNGTRINGERISEVRRLTYGDVITLGDVFVIFTEQPPDAPPGGRLTGDDDVEKIITLGTSTVLVADPAMNHIYAQIERLAATELSVLIWGETGSGKELAATALHQWSKRGDGPFVPINCAALPEGLAESELFGHLKGAFSGAVSDKAGLLESANGGTLFLDEIGDLTLPIQSKLLRVLETRGVTRLGAVQERKIDVRIIAASHRRLDAGVREGWFREDLFYRLNVAFLSLPPLRQRPRELLRLAHRFLNQSRSALGRAAVNITPAANERLMAHDWPGNIRELKNMMDYLAVTHGDGPLGLAEVTAVLGEMIVPDQGTPSSASPGAPPRARLQGGPGDQPPPRSLTESSREFERSRMKSALLATGGNKTKAAKMLGVPLRTFMAKIKRHGIA
ncbi:MAG TPA: sigma 54-interacting transcriptional regulator [Polyangia bacterium]|nr:sigma 54-interacting transcriptional regulator [Polyangia bacterium]